MSGICALWQPGPAGQANEVLRCVTGGLALETGEAILRDSDGCAGVGLVRRFASQQIYRNDRLLVAVDADLHNEKELAHFAGRSEPQAENARTAALIASLYERFGCDFAERLQGSFSVVLWDRRDQKLVAAIDGFGINRLVYYHDENRFVIASRISAITRAGGVDLEINPRSVVNILNFTSNLAPETILSKVHRVVPGTVLISSGARVREQKFWDMQYGLGRDSNEERLSRELEHVVQRSVADHCKDDPFSEIGAFLSGGTDSSTVVGMMSRTGQRPVKAFSIGFEEQAFNELGYAQTASKKFEAEHHIDVVGPKGCFEALPQMIRYFDEPFGNSSAIPTYFCARLAAQHGVKALLAGDGGDELFGGNERYATDKIFTTYHKVPRVVRAGLIEPALGIVPWKGGIVGRARGYVRRANLPPMDRFFSYQFLKTHALTDVFEGDFLKSLNGYSIVDIPARHYSHAPAADHLDRLLYVDMKITLADNDLPKVTCMSEMAGVQARFPFLDRRVAEFSGRVPARLKVKGFDKRYLFKRAFRNLLPAEIIKKKKHGFGIPVANWMKTDARMRELSRDVLLSARTYQRGYFQRRFVEDLFQKHDADDSSTYYGDALWSFLTLELWHRQAVDERTVVMA